MLSGLIKANAEPAPQTERLAAERVFIPAVDVWETNDAFVIVADLPGVEESAVDLCLDRNRLVLRGRRSPEKGGAGQLLHQEYQPGSYEREFTLGDKIDRDQVQATLANGVLRLVLPKVKELQPRRITVTTG